MPTIARAGAVLLLEAARELAEQLFAIVTEALGAVLFALSMLEAHAS